MFACSGAEVVVRKWTASFLVPFGRCDGFRIARVDPRRGLPKLVGLVLVRSSLRLFVDVLSDLVIDGTVCTECKFGVSVERILNPYNFDSVRGAVFVPLPSKTGTVVTSCTELVVVTLR